METLLRKCDEFVICFYIYLKIKKQLEATLNFNIPLSINELAQLIREQLPASDRLKLAQLLGADEPESNDEPTQEQLAAEIKQAVHELNLVKQGKMKVPTLNEFLNELQH